ncbi:membrane-associated protein, putative [Bodo saltans]|uniref:Membrane-associated protein, putative n=1 Tax=Bodo saltans TaxID=75058 RepID=A0A0S4J8R5_BODSA|nr:membrane-associated protein, putative [Bodo saltans]|eukprot:CUG86917.1 membrane-associated protein, putative [Bodo saltans]
MDLVNSTAASAFPSILLTTENAAVALSSSSSLIGGDQLSAASPMFVVGYLILINFLGSFIQGITTFGDAIVIQILWHALASATGDWLHQSPLGAEDVQAMALLQYSRTVILNPMVAKLAYSAGARFVPKKLIIASIIPQLLATIFGEHLLVIVPHELLKFYFGVICIVFAASFTLLKGFRYWQEIQREKRKINDDEPMSATTAVASPTTQLNETIEHEPMVQLRVQVAFVITSAVAGITGSLTGVGGPPFMILILILNLPPAFVRLLFPLASLPALYVRYGLAVRDSLITVDMIPYHAVSVAAGVVGVLCGNLIGKRVGPKTFNVVVFVLLVLAAMMMLLDVPWLSVVLLVSGAALMTVVWFAEQRELLAKEEEQTAEACEVISICDSVQAEDLERRYDDLQDEVAI